MIAQRECCWNLFRCPLPVALAVEAHLFIHFWRAMNSNLAEVESVRYAGGEAVKPRFVKGERRNGILAGGGTSPWDAWEGIADRIRWGVNLRAFMAF